ncbi:MAG: GGDEF domain-containing phosphodiesterase [bacterium]|nr:GGDEF domain-containing phosphodiesterase [bacterium]
MFEMKNPDEVSEGIVDKTSIHSKQIQTEQIQKKKIIVLGLSGKEIDTIKKRLGKNFEIVDNLHDYELRQVSKILDGDIIIRGRADFISSAKKIIEKNKNKTFVLYNIMIRHFDTLVSHFGDEIQEIITKLVLEEIINIFKQDIETKRNIVVGVISDRKFMILNEIKSTQNGREGLEEEIKKMSNTIIDNITKQKISISGKEISASVSMGISVYPYDGSNIVELLKASELALEESIKKGSNTFDIFTEELKTALWKKTYLMEELFDGIKQGKIYPVFQPIFSLEDMRIKGYEMLIRWKEKEISPDEIIKISEEIGLLRDINEFLFERISEICRKLPKYFFSFNITARFILEEKFFKTILENIEKYRIDPRRICFEISERSDQKEIEKAQERFSELKKLGFLIALDDYGSPQTLIAHIKDIPADIIKVDKEVIKEIEKDNEFFKLITNGIIYISHKLNRKVVVEGIETEREMEISKSMKFDMAQGFLLCPPLTEEEIIGE